MPESSTFVPTRLPSMGTRVVCGVLGVAFSALARVQVSGRENFPSSGNYIFVMNHLSVVDVGLGYVILQSQRARKAVIFAGDTWRKNFFTRLGMQLSNVIWVRRGETSPSTMKASLRVLRDGYILGVAPEGTRSRKSHALGKGQSGAAYIALAANVPIVPIALTNTQNLAPSIKRGKRATITATVGAPFKLEPCDPEARISRACLEDSTDEIMCRLAALLPPEYRGEYAEHPRVRELM